MKDIKSYVIGFLTCACLFLVMGALDTTDARMFKGGLGDITSELEDIEFQLKQLNKNMKSLKGSVIEFKKTAIEANQLNQRLTGLYEDIGHVLNRYYEIDEADKGDMDNDGQNEPDDEEYLDNKRDAITKAVQGEAVGDADNLDQVDRPNAPAKDGRDNDNDGYFVHSFKDCHPQTFEDRYPESPHFPLIVKKLSDNIVVAELFHGKTMAFKDFGARFLAKMMHHFCREIHIITATSGDTGSAVADAFGELTNIKVSILYPKGMVSNVQEVQMTSQGENVIAYEVSTTFDVCQDMVKKAFLDNEIKEKISSANSINIGRLLGQVFYYFVIVKETLLLTDKKEVTISIPSGNVGNITSCVIAKRLGLPIKLMIGACNINNSFAKSWLITSTLFDL